MSPCKLPYSSTSSALKGELHCQIAHLTRQDSSSYHKPQIGSLETPRNVQADMSDYEFKMNSRSLEFIQCSTSKQAQPNLVDCLNPQNDPGIALGIPLRATN